MMLKKSSHVARIALNQNIGFLAVIVICFLDDLLKLPTYVFSDHPFAFVFRESTLQMLLFLAVWLLVTSSTRRLLKRVRHLESFMRVCSWCRRIDFKGEWMPLERFMEQGFDTPTSHGICPDCLRRQKASMQKAREDRHINSQSDPRTK